MKRPTTRRLSGLESLEDRKLLAASILDSPVDQVDETAIVYQPAAQARIIARIVNGEPTAEYDAVGIVNGGCTGTLIAPNAVLTAAHCVEGFSGGFIGDTEGTFEVGGTSYSTIDVIPHPNYNPSALGTDSANDIAIMILGQNVNGIQPMEINRGTPQVGQVLTLVGYGGGGNGTSGHTGDFGTLRVGTTPVDYVTSTLIKWDFDNNSESNTAPGDSGGPAFITVNGQQLIAGVTSGGDQENAGIGDHSFDSRVDTYAEWIDGILGNSGGGDGGNGDGGDPGDGDGGSAPGDGDGGGDDGLGDGGDNGGDDTRRR